MARSPKLPSSLYNTILWNPAPGAILAASSLILRRNLSRYPFPSKLSHPEANQVVDQLKQTLSEALPAIRCFLDKELSAEDRQYIYEHFLLMHGFQRAPDGGGIALDETGNLLVTINLGDHLEMRLVSPTGNCEEAWSKLATIEGQIGKSQPLAFSPKFGYLTSDLSTCGTGLTVQAYLHLPALIHTEQLTSALSNVDEHDVEFSGLSGDLAELTGDLLIVENRYTIGMSEEAILHAIQTAVAKLISAEKMIRDHLKQERSAKIKDLISKGFGLLLHSHQLEVKEALDLISLMKLGLQLDLISAVTDEKLNALFFQCRKSHLTRLWAISDPGQIEQKRAELLKKELKEMAFHD